MTIRGQKLKEIIASGANQTIDLTSFAKSVYLVRIQKKDGSVSNVKVVKQ